MLRAFFAALKEMWQYKKLMFLFWGLNLVTAILFNIPILKAFDEFFSHRLVASLLARENLYTYYSEFLHYMGDSVSRSVTLVRMGAILHLGVVYLFSGGVIASLYDRKYLGAADFLKKSNNFMWPIFKSGIIAVIVLFLAVLSAVLIGLPLAGFLPRPFIESTYFCFFSAWILVLGFFLLIAIIFIDLLRIELVRLKTRSVWLAARQAFSSLLVNFLRMIGGYVLLVFSYIGLLIIYGLLQDLTGRGSSVVILFQFVLLQGFVFLLTWIKFSRFSFLLRAVEKSRPLKTGKLLNYKTGPL